MAALLFISCGKDDPYSPIESDTQSPSAPLNLTASNETETSIDLTWDAATDNVGVAGYRIFQDGVMVATNNTTSFTVSSLTAGVCYNFYVTAIDTAGNESPESNAAPAKTYISPLTYKPLLSEMGVFTGNLSALNPATGVQLYELHSTLFTDYASKQRLIRLPQGCKMEYNNSDLLPNFPDNTLIAKTFYYTLDETNPNSAKQIIETRILLKTEGTWNVGNYIWNQAQTDATYTENGSTLPISYTNADGVTKNIDYLIPSKQNCFTCHNNNNVTRPIGMKLRTMNFVPSYTGQNQLDYFTASGYLENVNSANISVLPDWTDDVNYDIFQRGRAYIDVNCAHCHQSGGAANNFNIDFRYETPFDDTHIYENRGEIDARIQSNLPSYRMPQLGRTIIHEEAVAMLLEYLDAIVD